MPPQKILNILCCQVLCLHIKSLTYCVVRSCASTANHKYLNSTKFTEKGKLINTWIYKYLKYFSEVCLLLYSLIEVCGGRFSRCMNKEDMDNMRALQMELLINMLNMTEVWFSYNWAWQRYIPVSKRWAKSKQYLKITINIYLGPTLRKEGQT